MIDGGIITGALIASALAGGAMSYMGAQETNETNRQIAGNVNAASAQIAAQDRIDRLNYFKATQDFQEIMSNSAYSRGMADMKRAGLNPILAYQQGGATSPSGASPGAVSSPHFEAPRMENALGAGVSSALQAVNTISQVNQGLANVQQTQAQTRLADAQTAVQNQEAARSAASTVSEKERNELTRNAAATELARQAQLRASAGLSSAQTATEINERRDLLRAEGYRAVNQGDAAAADAFNRRNYGPNGPVASTVGGISALVDNIARSLGLSSANTGRQVIEVTPRGR